MSHLKSLVQFARVPSYDGCFRNFSIDIAADVAAPRGWQSDELSFELFSLRRNEEPFLFN
jgi:hypothetical protein